MCEYCKRGKPIEGEDGFHVLIPKRSARGEEYVLYYEDFEGSLDSFLFRFCPMCGEKVGDADPVSIKEDIDVVAKLIQEAQRKGNI